MAQLGWLFIKVQEALPLSQAPAGSFSCLFSMLAGESTASTVAAL